MSANVTATDSLRIDNATLGGSALSRAIQQAVVPGAWHTRAPSSPAEWRAHADSVRESFATQPDWLEALHGAFGPITHTRARQRLADAARDGVVVTTGQQPGLFGGPAYTMTKALSALALADELSAQLRIPVAAVFWAATDDADWKEAAVTHVVGHSGLDQLMLAGPATEGVAMSDVPLGDLTNQRAALRAACGSVSDPLVLDLIDAAYTDGATVGSAYVTWLRSVLEPLGIVVLDASHAALRAAAHPVLQRALSHAASIDRALAERGSEIQAAGFLPQVEAVADLSLVFETTEGVRSRIPLATASERVSHAPIGSLGANVLLRPVLERALMPTVAYVAGPGELAYFAQVSAVADGAQLARPVAVPRWSATWREPHVDRVLERLGATDDELRAPYELEARLARAAMDRDVTDAMERLRVTIDAQIAALASAVAADDSLVHETVVEGLARDMSHRLTRVERRLLAAVKRRTNETTRDIAVARAAIVPNGSSPERVLSLVPVLARHGLQVLGLMREKAAEHANALVNGGASTAL